MTSRTYEVVIVGAGSIGLPTAFFLADAGVRPLVIDQFASPGQGSNKAALGGIRATHSSPSKIRLSLRSIEVFSTWEERYGDDIGWCQGGYCFVAYRQREERILKDLIKEQQASGLDIRWLQREELLNVVPDLNREALIGGTYSPGDGYASPLLSAHAFYTKARERGAEFRFGERVTGIVRRRGRVVGVQTNKAQYATEAVINAAGPWARTVARQAGLDVPVVPDSHEAGVTEPVQRFVKPVIIDTRPGPGSKNCYFSQDEDGQILFCISPEPPIVGTDRRETSRFLQMIAPRLINLMPKLANVRVRRTWRGLYPMTPDGFPIVGKAAELEGYIYAVGMCGQGYMLGPGVGELLTRMLLGETSPKDQEILEELHPYRDLRAEEKLK